MMFYTPQVYNAMDMCYKISGWHARLTKPPEASKNVWIRVTQRSHAQEDHSTQGRARRTGHESAVYG